ncbi:MAG: YdbC family protein [Christensenellales bacterium]
MAEFTYEVIKNYGQLSESSKGWKKEVKLISWNDKEAKYDIREWSPENDKMGKGVTLSAEEMKALKDLLNKMDL